jgi:ketosteroid isomerase-like protein
MELRGEETVGAGDLAYVRGRYTMTMAPPGGPVMADSGKYLEIWRKQGGSWKVTRDMFNSDVPLPMPAPATKP